jgi:ribonuclease G
MFKEIIINAGEEETRVAVLENKLLAEVHIERAVGQRLVGNIFKGRIENVLPGMQAAFVDIGLEKNAFLYVEDALSPVKTNGQNSITDVVKKDQEIIVQIVKEPFGTKGPRVTMHLTIPGRYAVLMPTVDYVGISRRIEDEKERERLKEFARKVKPAGMGIIMRTMAEGLEEEELGQDIDVLVKLWRKILNKAKNSSAPNLIHRDLELIQRILRDVFDPEVNRLIVDARHEYEKIIELLDLSAPHLKSKVILEEHDNIFGEYGLEQELEKALWRKVWLKCGGYLIFDQTEALTVIDVNTGKYVGDKNLEETVLRTNMEAAAEIGRQLRLRNIGGIIIVDFIDLEKKENRQKILQTLEEEIKKDKTKANILGITPLGLVEITRKKARPSLAEIMQKPCPYCEGRGKVLSEETVGINFKNNIYEFAARTSSPTILIEAHPAVAARLIGSGGVNLKELDQRTCKRLYIRGSTAQHIETVTMRPLYDQVDIQAGGFQPVKPGQVLEVKIEEPHVNKLNDGIARLNGFIVDIEGAGSLVGEIVPVEVSKVYRTYARAKLVK